MDSLPKRPNAPPSPPRRGPRHVSPPTVQRPGPSSWEPPRARSPQSWDREPPRGRPMFLPRSRSRSRSFDFDYDFQPRRSPPPPHPHSRLPRRAWERSRSRSPPPPPKSTVLCKYFSRPTGCDKGNRCRFRHQRARSRSLSRSRSYSRSPPPRSRSRTPPLHYRRGESPMLIPRGGMRASPPSLLQRLGPVAAPMRQVSPMRIRPISREATEPLEEGEERSPGRKTRKPRGGRGRKRTDRDREKGNWDSFVAADDDQDDYMSDEGRKMFESRRGRSHSRSPRIRTRSVSRKTKSRSRSLPGNVPAALTRSPSREKRSHLSARSLSRSRSGSPPSRSPTRSQINTPHSRGRSRTRSRSRSTSHRQSRSRSHSSYRRPLREGEPWPDHDRKNASPEPNPGPSSATVAAIVPGPTIPTGPRWRAPAISLSLNAPSGPRAGPGPTRGGPPPTGPRGDREPPRGPRNMMASGLNAGPVAVGAISAPGAWDRPQSNFQSYLAAVQSKLVQREVKKKEDPNSIDNTDADDTQADPNAMDVDVKEEPTSAAGSHLNTPAPDHPSERTRTVSPVQASAIRLSTSSPAPGPGVPLPNTVDLAHTIAQAHPSGPPSHLPLPPRPRSPPRVPRSPPRGPRATRGLPEKPKAMGTNGQDFGRERERDRDRDSAERGRDRNAGTGGVVAGGEVERKVHALPTNPARRPRMPTVRATKREVLFPEMEKEIASLEDQRVRLANEHLPHEIAFRQAVHDLTLSTIDYRAAEDRRVMTEAVLETMVKGTGVAAGDV